MFVISCRRLEISSKLHYTPILNVLLTCVSNIYVNYALKFSEIILSYM